MATPRYAVENLSIISCDVTGKPVVVLVGRAGRQEDGYILHNIGSMPEYPTMFVIEICKYFSPEEMIEPLTKAWASLLGGKPNKDNLLRLGQGTNMITVLGLGGDVTEMDAMAYSRDCLMTPENRQEVLDCGWSALTRPVKKDKGEDTPAVESFKIDINGQGKKLKLSEALYAYGKECLDAGNEPDRSKVAELIALSFDPDSFKAAVAKTAEAEVARDAAQQARQDAADAADQNVSVLSVAS